MDEATFWALIDETRRAGRNDDELQTDLLIEKLAQLPLGEVFEWDAIFDDLMDTAYIAELWGVASIIGCGCGDDGFIDFRAWLIGQGKEIYERALANPEDLADIVEIGQEDNTWSGLWYAGIGAYIRQTGDENIEHMPKREKPFPKLKGTMSDEAETLVRFPRAKARFWKRCLDMTP
jgi:hypothetical protein